MSKYHISKRGEVVPCRAVKGPCRAQTPEDIEQVHGTVQEVYDHMQRQFNDNLKGVQRKTFPPIGVVTDELVGSTETDNERTTQEDSEERYGSSGHHLFLHDTEGRAIAFIKVLKYSNGQVELCDIEVRPEYRGRKLSQRLFKVVESRFGRKLKHEGSYTEDGWKHVAPYFKSEEELAFPPGGVERPRFVSPMTFIEDWDREWPKYPL
jgi:GNAT superfamily N-acetyltransferase